MDAMRVFPTELRHAAIGLILVLGGLPALSAVAQAPPAFDGKRAFSDLESVCRIGKRVSGTDGMAQQQQMLVDHFTKLGATCSFQEFDIPHPETGRDAFYFRADDRERRGRFVSISGPSVKLVRLKPSICMPVRKPGAVGHFT